MPYIKTEDRVKFESGVKEAVSAITIGTSALFVKGEYFGFFVNRLVKKFMGDPNYTKSAFNSLFFQKDKRQFLIRAADTLGALLNRADPLNSAGELNYVISAVYWGILGDAEGLLEASYGFRAYLRGILEKVQQSVETVSTGNQGDITKAFRRHLVVRGVISDVIDEAYRRKTSGYEDRKMVENSDIWENGQLICLCPQVGEQIEESPKLNYNEVSC